MEMCNKNRYDINQINNVKYTHPKKQGRILTSFDSSKSQFRSLRGVARELCNTSEN